MEKQRLFNLVDNVSLRQGKRILRSLSIVAGLLLCAPPTAEAADSQSVKSGISLVSSAEKLESTTKEVTLFSMQVKGNSSLTVPKNSTTELSADYVETTGGKISLVNKRSSDWTAVSNGNITCGDITKNYIKIDLSSVLAVGDVINISDESKKFYITSSETKATTEYTVNGKYTVGDNLKGVSTIYIWWNAQADGIKSITVTREGSTKSYNVTASVNPSEGGSISIMNGETKVDSGTQVEEGTTLTFTASRNTFDNWVLVYWTVNGVKQEETGDKLTVKVTGETNVVANVKQVCYVWSTTYTNGTATVTVNGEPLKGETVDPGSKVVFTAYPDPGYKFVKWIEPDQNDKFLSSENPYVIESISLSRINARAIFEEEQISGTVYRWNDLGSQTYIDGVSEANGGIKFSSDYTKPAYMTIKPLARGFKVGDVVTIKGYCNSKNKSGIEIHATADGSSVFKTPALADNKTSNGSEYTFTITDDCDALYIGRFGGGTTYITSLTVERAKDEGKTRLEASFDGDNTITVVKKAGVENQTITLPKFTVKAGGKVLTADTDYTVSFISNDEDIAKYNSDEDNISILTTGTATIVATVTPVNTSLYERCTATYQVSVVDPVPLKVSTIDVTINTNDAKAEEPIVKVYDENDKLIDNSNYTLSYEVVNGTNVTIENGRIKVAGEERNWTEGKSTIKVTASPTDAFNAEGKYTEGSLTFTYEVNKGKKTPSFLSSFNGTTININKGNSRTITVPIIYNGEEVGQYFKYTYTSSASSVGTLKQSADANAKTLTFTSKAEGKTTITVSATPIDETNNGVNADGNDYTEEWNNPDNITFTINVGTYGTTTVGLNPSEIHMNVGQTSEAPDVTVAVGNNVLDDDKYSARWISNSPGVVKVDEQTGKLEAVSEGTANVRIIVNGDNLESTTAFLKVVIVDPAVYAVKSSASGETYQKNQVLTNTAGTLSVTLGGWMFPNKVTNLNEKYGTTTDVFGEGDWTKTASSSTAKITGFDAYVDSKNNQNARQENGSNAQVNSKKIYDTTFNDKGDVKDAMFNVPVSGSYLVFEPKTNGTVNAHIYQNGVFDKTMKNGKTVYQYRPQRRVFILDEAGKPVASEAQNQSPTGKPAGGHYNFSDYGWNLGTAPTNEADVMKHFKNLNDLKFTADGFENGVYESNLPTSLVPNAGADDKIEGSYGWCVLADAPVTYTFHVQAGKTYYLYNYGSKIGFYGFSFEEDENMKEKSLEYTQAGGNTIEATADNELTSVKIDRSFKAGVWSTCVLPFSLNKQQVDAIFGETYSSKAPNGTEIMYYDCVKDNTIYFHRHANNTIVAGKPFLIKPTKDVSSINTADVKNFPYVTVEKTEKPEDWCATSDYAWESDYNTMTVEPGSFYLTAAGKTKQLVGNSFTLKAFRGYLKAISSNAKGHSLAVGMSSSVDSDGATTIIEGLTIDANGNLVQSVADGKVYNVSGQVVSESSKDFDKLPSGVYIINGKKYLK